MANFRTAKRFSLLANANRETYRIMSLIGPMHICAPHFFHKSHFELDVTNTNLGTVFKRVQSDYATAITGRN